MAQQTVKLLVALPILACSEHQLIFKRACRFLEDDYVLHFYDPLEQADLAESSFSQWWNKQQAYFKQLAGCFDGYLGFSLGGMLLIRFFALFAINRPLVLLSTPKALAGGLSAKLELLLTLLQQGWVKEANVLKNYYVHAPESPSTLIDFEHKQVQIAQNRLYQGLFFVEELARQGMPELKQSFLSYYGSESLLVNAYNVYQTQQCASIPVQQSGMRVLSQGPDQVQQNILQYLRSKHDIF